MKNKVSLMIFFSILFLSFNLINAFEYDQSSLREEVTDISIHIFLEEGSYHLVIDNTGYVSGEYEREDTFVDLEIFAINGDPEYVSDSKSLPPQYYWDIPINTDTFFIFTIHFVFNITATKPVTVFLTDDQGFSDFEDEVEKFDFRKPPKIFLIIGIVIGAVVIAAIIAGFFERMRKKGPERRKTQSKIKAQAKKTTRPEEIIEVFYHCKECNVDYPDDSKTCPNCGTKLEKVKRKLEEV